MAITTTDLMPAPVQQSYDYKLLAVPVPNLIHKVAAMRKRMPAHGGRTLRMSRTNPLPTALVPLGNSGVTPPAAILGRVDIDATIQFYGLYVVLNEQVVLQNQDPALNQAVQRLGVSLRQSEDELTRDMLAASAAMINCVNGVNGDNPTEITISDVDEVTASLMNSDAFTVLQNIEGEDRFGSAPVRDSYMALASTRLSSSIKSVAGFIHKNNYPDQKGALPSEWGSIGSLRFLLSSIGSMSPAASALGSNVFNIFCCGIEAYACIEQDEFSAKFIYRSPIYDGPLALNCSVGYKFAEVPTILNDAWVINLRCTLPA